MPGASQAIPHSPCAVRTGSSIHIFGASHGIPAKVAHGGYSVSGACTQIPGQSEAGVHELSGSSATHLKPSGQFGRPRLPQICGSSTGGS